MKKSKKQVQSVSGVNRIKGLVIDLDNTLYDYMSAHLAGLDASYKKYPIRYSKQQFFRKYITHRNENEKALFGTGASHNRILYFQRMLESDKCFSPQKALDLNEAYWSAFIRKMTVTADTKKTLLLLVRKYKLGILTDLTADIQFSKLVIHRLWPFFDAVVTSEEAGIEKPNVHGLKLLLKKMKLTPKQVIFIGDNPHNDGCVSQKLGIKYVRLMRKDMWHIKQGVKPWKKIKKLSEILQLLKEL